MFWNDPDNYLMCVWIVQFVQLSHCQTVKQSEDSNRPDSITYVDDNFVTVKAINDEDIQVTHKNSGQG